MSSDEVRGYPSLTCSLVALPLTKNLAENSEATNPPAGCGVGARLLARPLTNLARIRPALPLSASGRRVAKPVWSDLHKYVTTQSDLGSADNSLIGLARQSIDGAALLLYLSIH